MTRAWMIAWPCIGVIAGCDIGLLPADYGAPAATLKGNVFPPSGDGTAPAFSGHASMSLQWLDGRAMAGQTRRTLIGQEVEYNRSPSIDTDWELHVGSPIEQARFEPTVDQHGVRVAVGQMVWFDDRVVDGILDWSCAGETCDKVLSISKEFVVYVDEPPYCSSEGAPTVARISRGYHNFRLQLTSAGIQVVEQPRERPLEFHIIDQTPAASDPTMDLRQFTDLLVASWNHPGC